MKDLTGRILYVGKAKNLRNRIRSYFQKEAIPKVRLLMRQVNELEFTVTSSELEALLLECNLIKKHRPRFNVRLKDDKNYPYFVLDFTSPFPQFRVTRKVAQTAGVRYFGPFSGSVQEMSRFLLKTFQIRDCSDAKFRAHSKRPCLNYEIGTCTAPCVNYVSEESYAQQVREAILFLSGRNDTLLNDFQKRMEEASDRMDYEYAKTLRDRILALRKVTEKQNAVMPQNRRDIDVVGLHISEQLAQLVILFIRSGNLTGRKSYRVQLGVDPLPVALRDLLQQFYLISLIPDEIWMGTEIADRQALASLLSQKAGKEVAIQKKTGEQPLRLLGMAQENARLIFEESKQRSLASASEALQKALGLSEPVRSVEGIDVSNLQSHAPVVSLVHFEDGAPLKSRYRLYHPKSVEGQNDFAMIHEAVLRRFRKREDAFPDLLMIDGGKGQLKAAETALKELKISIPICALAKSKTKSGFTLKELEQTEERVFVPGRKNPIRLREGTPALRYLQQVRDEAHRFAVKGHRIRRDRSAVTSELDTIAGVGEKTRKKLLQVFGSIEKLREATVESLVDHGFSRSLAEKVVAHFRR